ncbi:MAG: hypothetical protein ACOC6J_07905 [Spirochaetota bacterium]
MISVNLSVKQFTHPGLVERIAAIIDRNEVQPHCVKLEITEGIETTSQLTALRTLGSEYGQGYLFSRPVPAEEAGKLLDADPRW